MMVLNISCRDSAQSGDLFRSAFGEDKAEFRTVLRNSDPPCWNVNSLRAGNLQFRLAHLAIEYRWLCFHQDEATGCRSV